MEDNYCMAPKTKRELVWTYVLNMTHRQDDVVHHTEIADRIDVTEKTAREALHAMEEAGFIRRRGHDGRTTYVAIENAFASQTQN